MGEAELNVASELRRLAACADIPKIRRRHLLRLADELDPPVREALHFAPEWFADDYFRRPGMRLRLRQNQPGWIPNDRLLAPPIPTHSLGEVDAKPQRNERGS